MDLFGRKRKAREAEERRYRAALARKRGAIETNRRLADSEIDTVTPMILAAEASSSYEERHAQIDDVQNSPAVWSDSSSLDSSSGSSYDSGSSGSDAGGSFDSSSF